jgi:hypothetical protein
MYVGHMCHRDDIHIWDNERTHMGEEDYDGGCILVFYFPHILCWLGCISIILGMLQITAYAKGQCHKNNCIITY